MCVCSFTSLVQSPTQFPLPAVWQPHPVPVARSVAAPPSSRRPQCGSPTQFPSPAVWQPHPVPHCLQYGSPTQFPSPAVWQPHPVPISGSMAALPSSHHLQYGSPTQFPLPAVWQSHFSLRQQDFGCTATSGWG